MDNNHQPANTAPNNDGGDRQFDNKRRNNNRNNRSSQYGGNRNKSNNGVKFTGLNKEELEGIVICESMPTPTAQQFDALYDALIVYGGSRNSRTSLRTMKYITKASLEPPRPDKSRYTDENGKIDGAFESALLKVWEKECEEAFKKFSKYKDAIENLFESIMGQLGVEIKNNLKGHEDWEQIDEDNDTIGLLKILKELCYRDNSNKIDDGMDIIQKAMKFLMSRQNEKSAAAFVEETTNKMDVMRSVGGIILSPVFMKYVLQNTMIKGSTFSYQDYMTKSASIDKDDKEIVKKINDAYNQMMLARIIVSGSNDKTHQGLRTDLMKDFAKGHDNYPKNGSGALDLLNQFRVKGQQSNNRNHNQNKNQNNYKNRNDNNKNNDDRNHSQTNNQKGNKAERSFTNVSQSNNNGQNGDSEITVEKAHQLILKGIDKDEDSDEDFMFLYLGVDETIQEPMDSSNMDDWPIPDVVEEYKLRSASKPDTATVNESDGSVVRSDGNQNCRSGQAQAQKKSDQKPRSDSSKMEYASMGRAFLFSQSNDGIVDPW